MIYVYNSLLDKDIYLFTYLIPLYGNTLYIFYWAPVSRNAAAGMIFGKISNICRVSWDESDVVRPVINLYGTKPQ